MTIFAGPQDSGNMSQAQWEEVESKLWTDGVIAGARNGFVTTTTTGLGISVNTGDAILDGFRCYADAATPLTAATADPSLPRIDLLVFRINESAHTSTIALITGTPASSPVAPTATKTVGGTYELALYQVRVNAASTSITSLTDVRTYCGPTSAVNKSGDTMTGVFGVSRTLSGSDKTMLQLTATDGKTYLISLSASGKIYIFNQTDGVGIAEFGPAAGAMTANGATVWTAANDGSGSGLDADTVDGVQAAGLMQFGSGGQKTGFKVTEGNALPSAGMTKGDVHFLTPFVLP